LGAALLLYIVRGQWVAPPLRHLASLIIIPIRNANVAAYKYALKFSQEQLRLHFM
jgi:hypothetical protein